MISFRPAKLVGLRALLSSVWMELTRQGLQLAESTTGTCSIACNTATVVASVCIIFTCVLFVPTVLQINFCLSLAPSFSLRANGSGEFSKMHANALFNLPLVIHIRRITATLVLKYLMRFLILFHSLFLILCLLYPYRLFSFAE